MILNSLLFALQCTVACSWAFPLFACSSGGRPKAVLWAQQLKVGYRIVLQRRKKLQQTQHALNFKLVGQDLYLRSYRCSSAGYEEKEMSSVNLYFDLLLQ